ncbi:hypothetical protein [Paenibacillus sp. Soil787]|uniref:hypothetical protein n=1 Tax=Paenibacillus sp. Soil787 TaxID=1736411 RepID=UPI000702B9DE|nr:hypothetical protein [Paenibacillus sp. Soil787]KRF20184.1 hypothetical protein ASG93_31215 [Paenibacillus sp. Soil787]
MREGYDDVFRYHVAVKKRIYKSSLEDINHQFSKLKLSICDEIIDFGEKNNISDNTLINKYKENLSEHIDNVEKTFLELNEVVKRINNENLIQNKEFNHNGKVFRVFPLGKSVEVIYLSSFDSFTNYYMYGYLNLIENRNKYLAENTEVLFSLVENLNEFNPFEHIAKLVNTLKVSNTLQEINSHRGNIEQALINFFNVKSYRELLDKNDGIFTYEEYLELARLIGTEFRRSETKISLLEKGVNEYTTDLVDLIIEKRHYDELIDKKEWYTNELGLIDFDNVIAKKLLSIEKLMKDLKMDIISLQNLME